MCMCETAESPSCMSRSTRRARKAHWCCECPRAIKPGDRYEYTSGVWDGYPHSFRTCRRCVVLREVHHKVEGCSPPFESLQETIRECMAAEPAYLAAFRAARRELMARAS